MQPMKKNTVIFDLDGTLLYTLEDLTDSMNYVLEEKGYPARTMEEVRGFVGNGIKKLVERAVPDGLTQNEIEEVYRIFCRHYDKNCNNKTRPYDGIVDMLESLKANGCKTAIVSNKADSAVKELREKQFGGLIDMAAGVLSDGLTKPNPTSTMRVLKELGSSREEAVFVGDSEVDIETAENAGISVVSVSWGFKDREFLERHGAKVIIDEPAELQEWLKKRADK